MDGYVPLREGGRVSPLCHPPSTLQARRDARPGGRRSWPWPQNVVVLDLDAYETDTQLANRQ